MREDDKLMDLTFIQAQQQAEAYAKGRPPEATDPYCNHFNGFHAGFMANFAECESLRAQLEIARKGKKNEVPWDTTTTMDDIIDDLLGGGYEDGDEDLLG